MAEHNHTTYSCDRCKAELGSERPRRAQRSVVRASFNYQDGPGPDFTWADLCDGCDTAAKAFFLTSPAAMGVTSSERREARKWWEEVAAYKNLEIGEYIMVRTRRIMGTFCGPQECPRNLIFSA